jgi:hypothetical protein
MTEKKGKQTPLWKVAKVGRPRLYNSPDELWDAACAYFKWADDNPVQNPKFVTRAGNAEIDFVPIPRPYTMEALCLHMGVSRDSLDIYEKREEFFVIVKEIKDTVRAQKLEGAAAGMYNSAIVARDLGLKDQQDVTSDGQKIDTKFTIEFVNADRSDKQET